MKYFAKREIHKRLETLNDSQRRVYLRRALSKGNLISQDTADALNEELGKIYERKADGVYSRGQEATRYLSCAAESYASAGNLGKAKRILKRAHFKNESDLSRREKEIYKAYHSHALTEFKRERKSGLEKTAVSASIIGLMGGLFFLSSNLTGNVIGSQSNSNVIGTILLVIGLIGSYFWIKKRR